MNSDPNSLPLLGRCLIEASAGTGKTWTITGLVLRLLLGANPPGTPPAPARALREILIVTFTRAATEELRTRIRTRLRAARLAFASGGTAPEDDALIAELLAASAERERDHDRLHAAELELDLASIFTIHGFANRVLKRNAFESGISFAADIAEDDALLVRRTIHDFWRERVYPLPALPASQLLGRIDHAGFVTTVRNLLGRQGLQTLNAPTGSWQQLLATIDAEATRLLAAWRGEGPGFDAAIAETRLNKDGREALQGARLRMDAALTNAASVEHETIHALSRGFLASELAKKKGNALPALTVFDIAQTLDEHGTALYRRLLADALVELPRRLADAKDRSGQLGYDDLLRLLEAGLRGSGGTRLAATIREQYPVALIDEFQDTDLRQWEVFSTIYSTADSALFLVGDPKQAIYAFRGADVHAYLRARSTVSERRSLPTNYRTVATLIDAVNALFTLRTDNDPFLAGDAMPFEHIVVLMQENRSFDHYFSNLVKYGVAGVDVPADNASNPDPDATTPGSPIARFHETRYCVKDVEHDWEGVHQQYDNGKMDGFVATNNPGGARAMGYYTEADLPYYYWMAKSFAISDRHFCSLLGPTWPNRFYFYGGTSWGNIKTSDFGFLTNNVYLSSDKLLDTMDKAGRSWKIYRDGITSFAVVFGLKYLGVALSEFDKDVDADKLPALSIIDPSFTGGSQNDEHPPSNMQLGQALTARVLNKLMSKPAVWNKTVFILFYDEHGGFYDHVPPPEACEPDGVTPPTYKFNRLGIRTPLVIAAPWVKPGYVSHVDTDITSVTRFIQNRFDLPALTARDANAWPMLDFFDFEQPALATPPTGAPSAQPSQAGIDWCKSHPPGTGKP